MQSLNLLSTHLSRGKRGRDDAFEDLMEYWGFWRQNPSDVRCLLVKGKTTIAVAMEMHKTDRIKNDIPQPKQTRSIQPNVPDYWKHYRASEINKAVFDLPSGVIEILVRLYEDRWEKRDFIADRGWSETTYYNRLSEAKKAAKKHPVIRRMLHFGRN